MWQSCFSMLQWPAGTELRQMISSCQRTSVGIQRQTWIASSFTINIHKPSRNKLSQLFFKDSAKYWISTELKMSSASLEQTIFEILVWFCYWLKVTEKWYVIVGSADLCVISGLGWMQDLTQVHLSHKTFHSIFPERKIPNTATKEAARKDIVTWHCGCIIYFHPRIVTAQIWYQEWSSLTP